MLPFLIGGGLLAVLLGGWFLFYKISMIGLSREPDNGGAFKLVMIIVTPMFIVGAIGISIYVVVAGFAAQFIIPWLQTHSQ